jgi:ABC-type multidrug transport system fused ATPase/permease subunit
MSNKSTKEKCAPQETGTVMGFLTLKKTNKVNVYLFFLAIVAVLSPFLHVLYLINDKEGIFGFTYMSSFMYSLSLPLMAICSGLLLKHLATQLSELRQYLKYISNSFLFVGFFFLIYTFVPMFDFSPSVYFISLLILSVILTIAAHYLNKAIITTEERLKKIISKLFDFIILETPRKHVSEEKQIDYVISYEKVINDIGEE